MDEKIYKIGDYEFETLREYRQAQEDLKKIKYITDELDIYDPEVAIRLYTMMRTKKIRFKSEIGKSFFWCISDIVADSSQNMIEEKLPRKKRKQKQSCHFILPGRRWSASYASLLRQPVSDIMRFRNMRIIKLLTGLRIYRIRNRIM